MPTKERIEKIERVLSLRQPDLRVVLEKVTNTHNASAVARTCDAAGILHLEIISLGQKPFPINEAISTRAEKWLHFNHYSSTSECLSLLKEKGFKIAATHLSNESISYQAVNYTEPTAIIFGNESEGISSEALGFADYVIKIPMIGMVHSLNLSVSVGIILYEAMRQRAAKDFFNKTRLSLDEYETFRTKWLSK